MAVEGTYMLCFLASGLANWICSLIQVFILIGVLLGIRGGHLLFPVMVMPVPLSITGGEHWSHWLCPQTQQQ
jgi:hypothetical protein